MRKMKKITAMLTTLLLVGSLLSMSAIPAEGQIADENEDDFVRLENIIDPDNGTPIEPMPDIYVGQQGIQFALEVDVVEEYRDDNHNITQVWVEVDPDEELPGTWENRIEQPGADQEGANMTTDENNTYSFGFTDDDWYDPNPFEVDIDGDVPAGNYEMEVRVHYSHADETGEIQDTYFETYIEFDIVENAEVESVEATRRLRPGQKFQEMMVEIENDGDETISDINLTLNELPNGVSPKYDTARYPGELEPGDVGTVYYRYDVDKDMEPGIYDEIEYVLNAVKEDVNIQEEGNLVIEIGFAPILEAEIEDDLVVEQGDTSFTFDMTFENTGNVNLSEIEVTFFTPNDNLFLESVDYYEYGKNVSPEFPLNDLEVGEEKTLEITLGLQRNIQAGEHRLLFEWDGYFFNDGSFDEPTRYEEVEVLWEGDAPRTAVIYSDYDDLDAEDWIGPEAFFEVEMIDIDFSGEILDPVDGIELDGDITYIEIEVEITNHELVDFKDVEAQLMVGDNTPFFNPVDREREYVEMHGPAQELPGEGGTAEFTFTVDINTEFVSERIGNGSHAHEATLMITQAVNEDTNEEITDIEVNAPLEISGYGPNIVVEAELSDHDLEVGENFNLEYTIRNEGDETARETTVSMVPDLYDNENWSIIDGYIRALASEKYVFDEGDLEERSKNTSHLKIGLLGVEEAEDIVDLHMYIEGALSAPRPHIWNLYIGEINPGEEIEVNFEMITSEHTQIGQPYHENIHIEWIDAEGEPQEETYDMTIRLAEDLEEPDEPTEIGDIDATLVGVILVILILVIALAVFIATRKTDVEEESFEEMEEESLEDVEDEPDIKEEEEPPEPPEMEESGEEEF